MFIDKIILGNTVESYLIALSVLVLFWAFGQLFSAVIIKIIKKLASKTKTMLDDILVNILEKPAIFAITILGLYIATSFIDFGQRGYEILHNVFTILIVMNIVWVINRLIDALVEHYLMPMTSKTKSQLDDHLLPFVKKFLKIVVVIIGILFLIKNMGYDITSLVAGLGIGGLAFALAAQPLLSNLFGGLSIIADKPFQIGDRIRIDSKYEGYVKEMGMRSTTISSSIGTLIQIPNNVIATTAVENLSTTKEHGVKFTFELGLDYNTSAEKVEEALEIVREILKHNKNVVQEGDGAPYISFWDFKEYYLKLSGGFTIYPTTVIGATRTQINLEIKKRFEKAHIEFAFPTHTVYMRKD